MEDLYKTIKTVAEGLYKEKGSKFIALAYPVYTEEEIKSILVDIRTKYYDARHHCYAYRLGADKKRFRANDDGEPSSTAGKPILGQIVSNDLSNVLIVVIRYFRTDFVCRPDQYTDCGCPLFRRNKIGCFRFDSSL